MVVPSPFRVNYIRGWRGGKTEAAPAELCISFVVFSDKDFIYVIEISLEFTRLLYTRKTKTLRAITI